MSSESIGEALRLYREAGQLFRESRRLTRRAWQSYRQGRPFAEAGWGWLDQAAQNSAGMQRHLERIIELGETDESLRRHKVYALAHRNLGLYCSRHFKPFRTPFPTYMEETAQLLTTALSLGARKDRLVTRRLGAAYYQAGKFKEAVEPLRESVALDERDEVARYHLCLTYLALHERERAREQFEALGRNPASPHYHLVRMLEPLLARPAKQVDEAEQEEMRRAIEGFRRAGG
jgi:tetratricopeptide (TPR) repeat protein